MSKKIFWPDAVRLKMIEKSEFYQEPNIYQYGFYDGYQLAVESNVDFQWTDDLVNSNKAGELI